ncbi:hypothetical protein D3C77_134320 [compost metagenome]
MRKILTALALIVLAGCSTSPVTEETADIVPSERVYADKYVKSGDQAGKAEVVFLRDSGIFGSGCTHDVYVNNTKTFAIKSGEFIQLNLDPGPYFFRLETGSGICPDIATSQDVDLKAGAKVVYRILLPSDGSLRLTRIK